MTRYMHILCRYDTQRSLPRARLYVFIDSPHTLIARVFLLRHLQKRKEVGISTTDMSES